MKKSEKKGPSASTSTPPAAVPSGAPSTSKGVVAGEVAGAANKTPKKDATKNKATVYPTVVTAADFEDSDNDEGKKPPGKKSKLSKCGSESSLICEQISIFSTFLTFLFIKIYLADAPT